MDKKIKILLIEDSADDAILIKRKLESSPKSHYAITSAKTLEDGLAYITTDAPDLIISDLGLPDSHGLDTVKRILEKALHIPLVVLSGIDDESVAIRAVQAGAQDYLVKGQIENPQMERSLNYSIERARLLAEIEKRHQEVMSYQANMHRVLDKNTDAILVVNKDKRILFTNPATAELMGRKQKDLIKENFKYKLSTGKTIEIEIEQPDKKIKTADMSVVDIDWEGNPAYLVSIHDITQRKDMETALKNSEEKFAAVFRSSPDIIVIADLKTGKFIETNDSLTRVTGYTREETIGHLASDFKMFASPEDEAKLDRLFKEHGGFKLEEFSYRMKSGEIRQWLSSAEIFNIGDNQYVMTVSMDITERKRMEQAVAESEEKFSKVFRESPEVIIISTLEDGILLDVNDTFLRLTGYSRDELIGKNTSTLNLWVDSQDRAAMIKMLKEKGTVSNLEYKFRMKSGETRTWLFSAEIINIGGKLHMLSVAADITERKKMEDKLRFSDIVLKSIREGVMVIDTDHKITHWNDICEQMFGVKASDAIGKLAVDVLHAIEDYEGQNVARIELLSTKGFNREEQHYLTQHGDIWADIQVQPIESKGKQYGWLTLLSDITARKKMEEALKQSETKYRELIDTSSDAIISADQKMAVTIWNKGAEKIFGYSEKEMLGQPVLKIVPAFMKPGMTAGFNGFTKTGESQIINQIVDLTGIGKGDRHIPIELSVSSRKAGDAYIATAIIRDITQRKEAENALKTSEEKYRELIDTSSDAIITTDANMVVTLWNTGAEQIIGYTEKEMLGKPFTNVVPEPARDMVLNGFKEFVNKGVPGIGDGVREFMAVRKNGTMIPVEISMSTRMDGETVIATGIMRDITPRKQAEEDLKRSEEKYRELINTSNDAIVSVDSQMQFVLWNKGAEKMLGYKEKEILGLSLLTIFPEESQKDVARELVLLKQTGSSKTINKPFETNLLRKDCSMVPVEIAISTRKSDDKIISTAIMRDITIRKQAEEKIRESEERYRDLFENATDLIQSCNAEGKFVYVNKAWRTSLGYREAEVPDLILWDIIKPEHVAQCKEILQRVISGETVTNIETAFVAKDGKVINVEGNVNPIRKDDKVIATRAIFHDINVRKEAEEKLKQIDQMKSEFLSNVSHELRTPLQSISGFTKLIMNGEVPEKETQQEFLQIIDRETSHLGNLINGLLDMSRLEAGRFQINRTPVAIRDTILDSLKMFQSLAQQKNIELTKNIPENIPEMNLDIERIRQVIVNLLSNAVKFSDPGGSVKIKAETTDNELIFQVADHGTGIREENMKHLFERFYREEGEKVRGGTGLGLYISKQIIDAHGGRIWAESKAGEGSTFSFALPLNGKGFESKGVNEHG
jgi:PAS domain S-box-containing protein